MTESKSDFAFDPKRYRAALSRWDNEGGAVSEDPPESSPSGGSRLPILPIADAEVSQLHIRVIALENLVIALLAEASARQLTIVRDMVKYISPQPNFTPHPLTIRAASQMTSLVRKARRFGEDEPP